MGELLPYGEQTSSEVTEIQGHLIDDPEFDANQATVVLQRAIAARRSEREQRVCAFEYPYMPEQGMIYYVPADNKFMKRAKDYARNHSFDKNMPNCSIVVKDGVEIGIAANGSSYHDLHGCERKRLGSKTGEDYDKCEGCHPKNHGEPKAIADALKNTDPETVSGAEVYLWGHWWCCQPCWDAMLDNGVNSVFLLENSQVLFDREHTDNIIGRQFEE
jgi:hypothetical protein